MASSGVINQFNEQWRSSPLYQQGLQAVGEPTGGPITLDGRQRDLLKQWMMQHGVQMPQGATIDGAGNANEPEGFGHQLKKWGPIVGGAALTAFGIPGLTPGLLGGIGTGAGTAATGAATGATQFGGANAAGLFGSGLSAGTNSALGTVGTGLFTGAGTGAGVAGGIGGFLGGLGKQIGGDFAQRALGGIGAGLSGSAQASAHNRGVALDAELEAAQLRQQQQEAFENQLMARSRDDRESLSDAYGKSVAAQRTLNSTGYKPATLSLVPGQGPSTLPNFGTGMAAPTAGQKSDAQALYNQVQPRLTQGSQLPALQQPNYYQNDPRYMNAGAGERISSWLGPLAGGLGSMRNPSVNSAPYQPQQQQQPYGQPPKREQ